MQCVSVSCFSPGFLSLPAPPGLSPDWETSLQLCLVSSHLCCLFLALPAVPLPGASDVLRTFWPKLSGLSLLTWNMNVTSASSVSPSCLYLDPGLVSWAVNLVSGWAAQPCQGRGPAGFSDLTGLLTPWTVNKADDVEGRKPGRMTAPAGLGRPSLI